MKGKRITLTVLLILCLCLAASGAALAMSSANYNLSWTVLSGGGGDRSSSSYILGDTVGQSSAIGLSASTSYRLGSGFWYGVLAAPTLTVPPSVITNPATDVTTNSANLKGTLDDLGTASTVYVSFECGLTTAYGEEPGDPQAMTTTGPFSSNVSGLSPDTPCHFRAKAVGDGVSYGSDKSFATLAEEEFDPWSYDVDEDGEISKMEAVAAVADYFGGLINKQQALAVIVLYFAT